MTRSFCVVKEVDIQWYFLCFFQHSFLALVNLSLHVANQMLAVLYGKDDLPLSSISAGFILATIHSQKPLSQQERNMLLGIIPTQHTLQNGSNSVWTAIQTPAPPSCQHFWNSATALPSTISVKTRSNVSWQILQNPYDYFKPCFEKHASSSQAYLAKSLYSTAPWGGVGIVFFR